MNFIFKSKLPYFFFPLQRRWKHVNLSYNVTDLTNNSKFNDVIPSKPTLLIIHGLLGCKKNFESFAKVFSKQAPLQVVTIDARNHGDSEKSEQMDYLSMAEDVNHLVKERLKLENSLILGHSMGGKIAMTAALTEPSLFKGLIVVDISPGDSTSLGNGFIAKILKIMKEVNLKGEYIKLSDIRKQVDKELSTVVQEKTVRDFLLTNLIAKGDKVVWRSNIEAIINHYDDLMTFPPSLSELKFNGPTLFIGGSNSEMISKTNEPQILKFFPNSQITHIKNAGHWVHYDDPLNFTNEVLSFLKTKI